MRLAFILDSGADATPGSGAIGTAIEVIAVDWESPPPLAEGVAGGGLFCGVRDFRFLRRC